MITAGLLAVVLFSQFNCVPYLRHFRNRHVYQGFDNPLNLGACGLLGIIKLRIRKRHVQERPRALLEPSFSLCRDGMRPLAIASVGYLSENGCVV